MRMRRGLWVALVLTCLPLVGCGEGDSTDPDPATVWATPDPSFQMARQACTFTAGGTVKETLGLSDTQRTSIPIKHVVVLMKENRSFDHLLGKLHDQGQTASEPIPDDFRNPTSSSHTKFVGPFHAPTTCWTQGLIRPLFDAAGCDVAVYTDREIAKTMLQLCPESTDWWLSTEHLRQSFERSQGTG